MSDAPKLFGKPVVEVESLDGDTSTIIMYPPTIEMTAAILRAAHSDSDDEVGAR